MNPIKSSERNQNLFILLVLFILLLLIFSLFPITGDDWARYAYGDTEISITRVLTSIKNDWLGLNGRVLGNTMSKLLMSPDFLRTFSKTSIVFAIYLSILYLVDIKFKAGFYVLFLLMILMPKETFRESYQWSAGFFNYVPPVTFLLLYFVLLKRTLIGKIKYKKISYISTFILGMSVCLFVEHISIYNIFISVFMVIYFRARKSKWCIISIAYMLGAFFGAFTMFSSPVYLKVFSGDDFYRDIPLGILGIFNKAINNFPVISDYILAKNVVILLLLTGLLLYLNINRSTGKNHLTAFNVFVLLVVPFYFITTNELLSDYINESAIKTIFTDLFFYALYFFSFISTIVKYVNNSMIRNRIYFYIISIIVLVLPLFIVSPIGSRLFYIIYIILILVVMELCNYLEVFARLDKDIYTFILLSFVLLVSFLYIFIYYNIHEVESMRDHHIQKEIKNNEREIEIPEFPYREYIHQPHTDSKKIGYKFYRDEPSDIYFSYISLEEWLKVYKKIY